jgi:hypothetical protein
MLTLIRSAERLLMKAMAPAANIRGMKWAVTAMLISGCRLAGPKGQGAGDDGGTSDDATPAELDTDHDGIPDRLDNCPFTFNPDQRDHDKDGRGDVCDVCPHLADAGGDLDGDGVGDACDPHPTQAGDRIVLFEGFYAPVSWDAVIGSNTWEVADNVLRQTHTDGAYQLVHREMIGTLLIDTRVRVNQPGVTGTRRSTGLVFGYRSPDDYDFCGLADTTGQTQVEAGKVYVTAGFDFMSSPFAGTLAGDSVELQARLTRTTTPGTTRVDCSARRNNTFGRAIYDASAEPGGDIGVRTNGVGASFDYVFVVETPN